MSNQWIRICVGLFLTAILAMQARSTQGQPQRRRAFIAATAAAAIFTVATALPTGNQTLETIRLILGGAAVSLLVVAVFFFSRAWRTGELATQAREFREEMQAYGKERDERLSRDDSEARRTTVDRDPLTSVSSCAPLAGRTSRAKACAYVPFRRRIYGSPYLRANAR